MGTLAAIEDLMADEGYFIGSPTCREVYTVANEESKCLGAPEEEGILTNPEIAASMVAMTEVVIALSLPAVSERTEVLETVVGGPSTLTNVVARIGELPTVAAPTGDTELGMPCLMGFTPPSLQPVVTLPSEPTRGNNVASGGSAPENQGVPAYDPSNPGLPPLALAAIAYGANCCREQQLPMYILNTSLV